MLTWTSLCIQLGFIAGLWGFQIETLGLIPFGSVVYVLFVQILRLSFPFLSGQLVLDLLKAVESCSFQKS